MTRFEKQMMRYWIIRKDPLYTFDFTQNFFAMDWNLISRIGDYAEIFGIKGTASGKSPARNLWDQLQIAHEYTLEIR